MNSTLRRRSISLSLVLISSTCLALLWWYVDARIDSYFDSSDSPDFAQIINACVADADSAWQLPYCRRGFAALGLYRNDCRAPHTQSLFFMEKHYACTWLDKHMDEVINVNSNRLGAGGVPNPLHVLVRRHAWCQRAPQPCTDVETLQHPHWCLPEPEDCAQAQLRSIDWLLGHGVDINTVEFEAMTVLDYAVHEENYLIVPDLLRRGADPNIIADKTTGISTLERARSKVDAYRDGDPPEDVFRQYSRDARAVLDLLEARGDVQAGTPQ